MLKTDAMIMATKLGQNIRQNEIRGVFIVYI
jgi:hypothetical protein